MDPASANRRPAGRPAAGGAGWPNPGASMSLICC